MRGKILGAIWFSGFSVSFNLFTYCGMPPLFLFLTFLFILDPLTDWYLIEKRKAEINHIRGATLFLIGILVTMGYDLSSWMSYEAVESLWDVPSSIVSSYIVVMIMIPPMRWIIHDLLLNIFRGVDPWYHGDGKGDALSDSLIKSLSRKYDAHPFLIKCSYLGLSSLLSGAFIVAFNLLK